MIINYIYISLGCKYALCTSFFRSDQTGSKCLIPPEKKWTSLFSNCRQSLCCRGDLNAQHTIVWKALSVCLITGRDTKLSHNDQEVTKELLRINRDMEQKSLGCTDLQTIQAYLSKVSKRTYG